MPTSGRRPKIIESRRVCQAGDCETVLSKYNLSDTCRVHTGIRFPRVRGRNA